MSTFLSSFSEVGSIPLALQELIVHSCPLKEQCATCSLLIASDFCPFVMSSRVRSTIIFSRLTSFLMKHYRVLFLFFFSAILSLLPFVSLHLLAEFFTSLFSESSMWVCDSFGLLPALLSALSVYPRPELSEEPYCAIARPRLPPRFHRSPSPALLQQCGSLWPAGRAHPPSAVMSRSAGSPGEPASAESPQPSAEAALNREPR